MIRIKTSALPRKIEASWCLLRILMTMGQTKLKIMGPRLIVSFIAYLGTPLDGVLVRG